MKEDTTGHYRGPPVSGKVKGPASLELSLSVGQVPTPIGASEERWGKLARTTLHLALSRNERTWSSDGGRGTPFSTLTNLDSAGRVQMRGRPCLFPVYYINTD
jgi:hypothetical protein